MTRINFLPHRLAEEQKRQQRFCLMLGSAMTAGIVSVWLLGLQVDHQIRQQTSLVQLLQAGHEKLDAQIRGVQNLQAQIDDLVQKQQDITALRQQQNQIIQLLQTLANRTPSSISLRTLKQQATRITLSGNAASPADVMQLLANLREGKGMLSNIELMETHAVQQQPSINNSKDAGHAFVLTAEIAPVARQHKATQ